LAVNRRLVGPGVTAFGIVADVDDRRRGICSYRQLIEVSVLSTAVLG
jgi:hypothetical protein